MSSLRIPAVIIVLVMILDLNPTSAQEPAPACLETRRDAFPEACKQPDLNLYRTPNELKLYGYKFSKDVYFVPRLARGGKHIDVQTAQPTREFYCEQNSVKYAKTDKHEIYFCKLVPILASWKLCLFESDAMANYKNRDGQLRFGISSKNHSDCKSNNNPQPVFKKVDVKFLNRQADFQMTSSQESVSTFCRLLDLEATSKCDIRELRSDQKSLDESLESILKRLNVLEGS